MVMDSGGPKEACIRCGSKINPHLKGQFLGVGHVQPCLTLCRQLCKNSSTDRDAIWIVDLGRSKEAFVTWGDTLAQPGNTTEITDPSVCDGNAAFSQITYDHLF